MQLHKLAILLPALFFPEALAMRYLIPFHRKSWSVILGRHVATHRPVLTLTPGNSYQSNRRCISAFLGQNFQYCHRGTALRAATDKQRQSCIINNSNLSNVKHWFTLSLPEGLCVGVTTAPDYKFLNDDNPTTLQLPSPLHNEEYTWGKEHMKSELSRTSFYLGRMALRSSLHEMLHGQNEQMAQLIWDQIERNPIRKDSFGRPILPNVVVGSISHKGEYAVGLSRLRFDNAFCSTIEGKSIDVDWREECIINSEEESVVINQAGSVPTSSVEGVGVDIERVDDQRATRIQRKVLTEKEQNELGSLETVGISKEEEVMLRFSLKESVYKAMHPILCDYVGLQEAEVDPLADGTAVVRLNFLTDRGTSVNPRAHSMVVRSASWRKINGFFLTSASVGIGPET